MKIRELPSDTKFKFGDGEVKSSLKSIAIPAFFADREVTINTDVL